MKKILFYGSIIILIYLIYIVINIFTYHYENLNNYGNGFLIGKILLILIFGFVIYKTNPFKEKTKY
ncbi:hypothetical protein LPBF_12620 [Flavobacterium crassostreae]|uniref:C4-dicarboxylate ABC transporter n=1 Tax=Flavobacterium crassostreae TaxID=1763534 RepID=A0A1B9DFF9_9FLAO|nr:hypothetical protein LPBF_12620 [Flavobacterium crassostreae]